MIACSILSIFIISMFKDAFTSNTHNVIHPSQNIKVIETVEPITAILKDGEEIYIKEPNGQLKKINEFIRMEDGIKIPKTIIDRFPKIENIKVEQIGNTNFKCPVNSKDVNTNIVGCINDHMDLQAHTLQNIVFKNGQNVPIQQVNFVEHFDEAIEIHKNIIQQIEKMHAGDQGSNKVNNVSQKTESEPIQQLTTDPTNKLCTDSDIVRMISESLVEPKVPNIEKEGWDQHQTETESRKEVANSFSHIKYLIMYVCIILMNGPLLRMLSIILFISDKVYTVLQVLLLPLKVLANMTIFGKVLQFINDQDFGWSTFTSQTSEGQILHDSCIKNKSVGKDVHKPCKYCNDFSDYNCPTHSHLYSTDEASSSEIDFAGHCSTNGRKGKQKKNKKDSRKSRNAY